MVRKVLIGVVVALVFLGPGIALVTIAALVVPSGHRSLRLHYEHERRVGVVRGRRCRSPAPPRRA